jgi:hypothetical protein
MEVYTSINATLDPDAKRELLGGNINLIHCASCGLKGVMAVDVLYHDMDRGFLARFVPPKCIDDTDFMTRFDHQGQETIEGRAENEIPDYFHHVHVVFSLEELANYVRFRDILWMWRLKRTRHTLTSRQQGSITPTLT